MSIPFRIAKLMGNVIIEKMLGSQASEAVSITSDLYSQLTGSDLTNIMDHNKTTYDKTQIESIVKEILAEKNIRDNIGLQESMKLELTTTLSDFDNTVQRFAEPDEIISYTKKTISTYEFKKKNSYLFYLKQPYIHDEGWCHVSWQMNLKTGKASYRIRDYTHNKLYYGVTKPTESGWNQMVSSDNFSLLDLWHAAADKKPCTQSEGLRVPVKDFDWWKKKLDELNRVRK
jgi:hypothetical protein